jgi:uncharacterized protein (DUF427 family)
MDETSMKTYRRVVTGHRGGKAVVLSDDKLATYAFKSIPGFEHTYVWTIDGTHEADPASVDAVLPKSALPPVGGSLVQIVTFPPADSPAQHSADPKAIAREYLARLPELAETFEPGGSQIHATSTIDYALILEGELWLESVTATHENESCEPDKPSFVHTHRRTQLIGEMFPSSERTRTMRATLNGEVIAESDDIEIGAGYQYFPASATRLDLLQKVPKTEADLACPHSVQFYDVVIDGVRHERAAWSYEAPRPSLQHVDGRFGFWHEVEVA